ncbi:hypothetical protein ACFL6F_03555, partial [Planctomycetota bacterium]
GGGKKESVGIHINPNEIILFSPVSRKNIPIKLKKGSRISLILNAQPGRDTEVLIDGKKIGVVPPPDIHFMGTPVLRIDNTVLQVFYMKASSET